MKNHGLLLGMALAGFLGAASALDANRESPETIQIITINGYKIAQILQGGCDILLNVNRENHILVCNEPGQITPGNQVIVNYFEEQIVEEINSIIDRLSAEQKENFYQTGYLPYNDGKIIHDVGGNIFQRKMYIHKSFDTGKFDCVSNQRNNTWKCGEENGEIGGNIINTELGVFYNFYK